ARGRRLPRAAAARQVPRPEALDDRAVGHYELRPKSDRHLRDRRSSRQLRVQGRRRPPGQRPGRPVARPSPDDLRSRHPARGRASVLEMPGYEEMKSTLQAPGGIAYTRTLNIDRSPHDLLLRVAPRGTAVALVGGSGARLSEYDGYQVLRIPAADTPIRLKLL